MLLACACLIPATAARAGSWNLAYSASGTTTGTVADQPYSQAWAATAQGGSLSSTATEQATVAGTVTATLTWTPAAGRTQQTDPPSSQVIVSEAATASFSWGWRTTPSAPPSPYAADDGLKDAPQSSYTQGYLTGQTSSGTHWSVKDGSSGSITLTCVLNAQSPAYQGSGPRHAASASANYSVAYFPVAVSPGGTYNPSQGDNRVLTGQQITATLSGLVGTLTNYTWSSPSATCFKTYNEKATSNQLVALGSSDLSGPAAGSTAVSALNFYDRVQEDLTVTCTATMTAPDGKTVLNVTAKSPTINVLKPTASWGVDPKTVPANGTANSNQIGFHDDSATSLSYGVNTTWYPDKLSVPSPFSGGQGCFAQLVTPSATITRTPTGKGVSTYSLKILNAQGTWIAPGTGLDGSFPYAFGFTTDADGSLTGIASDSSWQASGTGASGDNPKGQETTSDVDNGGTMWTSSSISDSFTTWLMYKPDGGVWIPVKSATWKASGSASGGPNNWSATGNYTAPSPMDAKDPPQWNTVISGQQYRP